MTVPSPEMKHWIVRGIAAICFSSIIALMIGPNLLALAIPIFRWELQQLDDSYRLDSLTLTKHDIGARLILNVGLVRSKLVGKQVIVPDRLGRGTAKVSILCGPLLFPWLFAWSFLLSVPALSLSKRLTSIGMATLLIVFNSLMDAPLIFLAELEDMFWSVHHVEENSLLIIYREFLDGGGRIAIGLWIGWLGLTMVTGYSNFALRHKTDTQ